MKTAFVIAMSVLLGVGLLLTTIKLILSEHCLSKNM